MHVVKWPHILKQFCSGTLQNCFSMCGHFTTCKENERVKSCRNFTSLNYSDSKKEILHPVKETTILLPDIPVDDCTFCLTFSFKAEGYTENTLIHYSSLIYYYRTFPVDECTSFRKYTHL